MVWLGAGNILTILLSLGVEHVSGAERSSGYGTKDEHYVPRAWRRIGPAPGDHMIRLQIGLKQSGFSELERHLYEGKRDVTPGRWCISVLRRNAAANFSNNSLRSCSRSLWAAFISSRSQ